MGQNITVAQLADPEELSGPIQRAPVEMGDADQDGLKVQMAQTMAPYQPEQMTAPVLPTRVAPKAAARKVAAAEADEAPTCAPARKHGRHGRRHHAAKCETAVAKASAKRHGDDDTTQVADCDRHGRKHHRRHAKACAASETEVAKADRKHGKAADEDGGFAIQVGAYKSRAQAKEHLAKVTGLVSGSGRVEKSGANYRARFGGLTQKEAKAACHKLSAKGQHCVVAES
jgi:cell division septation protein DedD